MAENMAVEEKAGIQEALVRWWLIVSSVGFLVSIVVLLASKGFEGRPLLLTVLAAGMGSSIMALRYFSYWVFSLDKWKPRYTWWYPFWQLKALLLGLVFYCVVMSGLFKLPATGTIQLEATLVVIGSVVGMFSNEAIDFLYKLFQQIFNASGDESQKTAAGAEPSGDSSAPVSEA
jgi:hypothetical protein